MTRWLSPILVAGGLTLGGILASWAATNFSTFVSTRSVANQPLGASDWVPVYQGGATVHIGGANLVTTTDAQTLTNKTIAGGSNNLTVRAQSDITGTVGLVNGGLGLTSGNSGGVPCFNSASSIASSVTLTANLPMIGGGAGGCPGLGTVTGTGTLFVTGSGAYTNGHGGSFNASGNFVDNANAVFSNNPNTFTPTQTFGPVIGHHRSVSTTTDTLVVSGTPNDCGGVVQYSSTTPVTVTLPNSTPIDCWIDLEQTNTGRIVLSAASGASFTNTHGFTGTFNAAGAVIGLYVDQNQGGGAAHYVLTGDGA